MRDRVSKKRAHYRRERGTSGPTIDNVTYQRATGAREKQRQIRATPTLKLLALESTTKREIRKQMDKSDRYRWIYRLYTWRYHCRIPSSRGKGRGRDATRIRSARELVRDWRRRTKPADCRRAVPTRHEDARGRPVMPMIEELPSTSLADRHPAGRTRSDAGLDDG